MNLAPILLFVYIRVDHVRRTVDALLKNHLSEYSDLIIFSDGARSPGKQSSVDEVRAYLTTISGFRSVTIHRRPNNFGLAKSIVSGVTQVLAEHERIIVLEDDMWTSPHFLTFMNTALERFSDDDRVISIHGYVYPVATVLPEAFFLLGADCWGWATWRRGWNLFNPDGGALLAELKRRNMLKAFDFNNTYGFSKMLESQVKGNNDSWAILWYASAFIAGKLTLYPGRSLVHNIGNDSSGTHCSDVSTYNAELSRTPVNLHEIEVLPSVIGQVAFEAFFRKTQVSLSSRLRLRISNIWTSVTA